MHILRGGCAYAPVSCRSAERDICDDWHHNYEVIGFRLALIPEELTPVEPSPFSDREARRNAVPPEPREGGLQVRLPDGVMLHLESIPAGEFEMGSPDGETGRTTREYWQAVYDFAPEKAEAFSRHTGEARRRVSIGRAFWLGRLPVTREQYAAVTGADLSLLENRLRPMTQVFWEDSISFCERLNVLCRDQLPEGYRFAIPTEEQWEYACRAGTTTALNSGKDLTQGEFFCPNLAEVAWFQMNSGERKRDAGLLRPNAWGLYDMHGNVWEWCVCTTPADDGPLSVASSGEEAGTTRRASAGPPRGDGWTKTAEARTSDSEWRSSRRSRTPHKIVRLSGSGRRRPGSPSSSVFLSKEGTGNHWKVYIPLGFIVYSSQPCPVTPVL